MMWMNKRWRKRGSNLPQRKETLPPVAAPHHPPPHNLHDDVRRHDPRASSYTGTLRIAYYTVHLRDRRVCPPHNRYISP